MDITLIFSVLEHIGVIAFAISGAIVAIDREMDIFGVVFLSFVTSFGGGIMRDLFLGLDKPLFFTKSYVSLIIVCFVSAIFVFFFAMLFKRLFIREEKLLDNINNYIDAVGIGAFTVSGAKLAIDAGNTSPFVIIVMGMIACIGGGMLRDIMLNDIPFVLRKRIYALAAAAGAGVYYLLWRFTDIPESAATVIGTLITIFVRVLATLLKWNAPKAINFSKLRDDKGKAHRKNGDRIKSTTKRRNP